MATAGPNTGGMGAFSTDELLPVRFAKPLRKQCRSDTARTAADGIGYQGFLRR